MALTPGTSAATHATALSTGATASVPPPQTLPCSTSRAAAASSRDANMARQRAEVLAPSSVITAERQAQMARSSSTVAVAGRPLISTAGSMAAGRCEGGLGAREQGGEQKG